MDVAHHGSSVAADAMKPRPALAMWSAAWLVTAVFMLSNAATPLYVIWQQRMGFSSGTLTLIFAAYIAGLLAALLVAGQMSDRMGRKPVLIPGLIAALIASYLFATATSVPTLMLARLLTGVAVGVIVSAGMASVVDLGGIARRRLSALAASAAMVLGAGMGPLLAGIFGQFAAHPVTGTYAVLAVILASAMGIAYTLKMPKPHAAKTPLRLRFPAVPTQNRIHLALGISVFAPGLSTTSFVAALGPSLLSSLLHVHSPLVAGAVVCLMFLSATGVQLAVRSLHVRTILLLGAAASVLSMIALSLAANWSVASLLIVSATLGGAAQGLGQLGGLTLIGMHVPDDRRAEANSLLNFGAYVPAGISAVATGFLIDAIGMGLATIVFAAFLCVSAVIAITFILRRLRHDA